MKGRVLIVYEKKKTEFSSTEDMGVSNSIAFLKMYHLTYKGQVQLETMSMKV